MSGFMQLKSCECVSRFRGDTHKVIIFIYVDDLVILSPEINGVKWAKEELKRALKLTDLDELKKYIGVYFK